MLQSIESQRVGQDLTIGQQQQRELTSIMLYQKENCLLNMKGTAIELGFLLAKSFVIGCFRRNSPNNLQIHRCMHLCSFSLIQINSNMLWIFC